MKKLFLIAAVLFFSPVTIFACSCLRGEPAYEFNRAELVFIGRLRGGTEKFRLGDRQLEAGKVRFAVEEVFKGQEAQEFTLQVDSALNTSCAYGMIRGERYLVYAFRHEQELRTGMCTRTILMTSKYVAEDLKFLRNLPPPGVGGAIKGILAADLKDSGRHPLRDIRVKIINADGQVITVFTDAAGEFKATQLKPGKYKVEPDLPANYVVENKFVEVDVADRGLAYASFEAKIDSRVSGRVIDADGNAFNSIHLKMVEGGKTVFGYSTGEDGVFEVEGAPLGQYLIYVELESNDYSKRKPYYYPGTFEREKAAVIRVGLGEKVEGLEFRLPAGYLVRTIEGEVVWDDGTPAANVEVALLCPKSTDANGFKLTMRPPATQTDEHGRFRMEGITGEHYWLEARGRKEGKKPGEVIEKHSAGEKISFGESVKNVKLKLSEEGYFGGCPE